MNAVAMIGHNRSSFDLAREAIEDLYAEAKTWLDGEPVTEQQQADALNTLQSRIREAAKDAEKNRKAEAKPFDDGKAEVQARYKPVLSKAEDAENAVKAALKPYLLALQKRQEEEARAARAEAARKQEEALAAIRSRDAANLAQVEEAERLVKEAKAADEAARKAENVKAHARGDGRATGLRTVHRAVMMDPKEAAAWVWVERRDELMIWVQDQADKAVRAGARKIRGFEVIEEKTL